MIKVTFFFDFYSTFIVSLLAIMTDKSVYIKDLQHRIAVYEDEVAYKQLFLHLFPSLQSFSFSIVKSRELAEEIVSDIFIEIWAGREGLLKIENLKLYMFISVRNLSLRRRIREKKKGPHLPLEAIPIEFISDYGSPEESLQLNELERKIRKAVKELPARCQLIYKLAKEDKLKYKEIAELLKLSIKTIDNQLAIALKKIASVVEYHIPKKSG